MRNTGSSSSKKLREYLSKKEYILGTAITISDPVCVELAALAGFDYVRIEREHSSITDPEFVNLVRAADIYKMPVLARTASSNTNAILPILEAGAAGILVPHISTPAEAEKVIKNVRYAPYGERSLYTKSRSAAYGLYPEDQFIQNVNSETIVGILIEDKEGLDKLEDILAVPGIDFVSLGRHDYSQSIGIIGQTKHKLVYEAEEKIINCAIAAGVLPSLSAQSEPELLKLLKKGVKFLFTDSDMEALYRGFSERNNSVREMLNS